MSRRTFWLLWFAGNVAWVVVAPAIFGVWLASEVDQEYATGARVNTDGDSLGIPVFGFAIANLLFVLLVNMGLGAYALFKRKRT